jgi:hypothetical protein
MNQEVMNTTLDHVEFSLNQLAQALLEKNPDQLLMASNEVQRLSLLLPKLLLQSQRSQNTQVKKRLLKLSALMASSREALFRHAAVTQRALAALVPSSQESTTYTPAAGRYARQPYGSVGRQSGEFKALTA